MRREGKREEGREGMSLTVARVSDYLGDFHHKLHFVSGAEVIHRRVRHQHTNVQKRISKRKKKKRRNPTPDVTRGRPRSQGRGGDPQ